MRQNGCAETGHATGGRAAACGKNPADPLDKQEHGRKPLQQAGRIQAVRSRCGTERTHSATSTRLPQTEQQ